MAQRKNSRIIWRITDGKRGHERQTQGLVQALASLMPVQVVDVPRVPFVRAAWYWLSATFPAQMFPTPALIVGAGHGTHLTMLAARRSHGGKTVVLMQPGLPTGCFDLCLIPRHDNPGHAPNIMPTSGALNAVRPSPDKDAGRGLMLIGGISKHYRWDDAALLAQIDAVARADGEVKWTATTSPRTPESLLARLGALHLNNLEVVPCRQTTPDWLPAQLARSARVWVSPDSVSMVYEALTSGAATGIFSLEKSGNGRVTRGVDDLLAEGRLVSFADWRQGKPLPSAGNTFNEAARCALWIKNNWFPEN